MSSSVNTQDLEYIQEVFSSLKYESSTKKVVWSNLPDFFSDNDKRIPDFLPGIKVEGEDNRIVVLSLVDEGLKGLYTYLA